MCRCSTAAPHNTRVRTRTLQDAWASLEEDKRSDLLGRQLWRAGAMEALREEQEQEVKLKYGNKYKRYVRFKRKYG